MTRLHVHTREIEPHRPATIARAVHFTLLRDGREEQLRNGAGVIYAPAAVGSDWRMQPQVLDDPRLTRRPKDWLLTVAISRTGEPEETSRRVGYRSQDLLEWDGPHPAAPFDESGTNTVDIDDATAAALEAKFGRIRSVAVDVDDSGPLSERGATIRYSDGSSRRAKVDWDAPALGRASGAIRIQDHAFPFIADRADPHILEYDGRWLFVATPDAGRGNEQTPELFIRAADTIEGLPAAPDHTIARVGDAGIGGCFWAPELHTIAGELRILFAPSIGTASWDGVQCHIMTLRPGGNPLDQGDWSAPAPVLTADGHPLRADERYGISLDMTYVPGDGGGHYVWSQRVVQDGYIGDAELWIAGVDPTDATRLRDEPRRLHTGRYSWELTDTNVVEGPFPLLSDDRLHLAYAAAAVGPHYATGWLSASTSDDPGDPSSWSVQPFPALDSASVPGQWGPGHISFFRHAGDTMMAFHAKIDPDETARHTGIRRVHWAHNGLPVLDMTPEEDLHPDLRVVTTLIEGPS